MQAPGPDNPDDRQLDPVPSLRRTAIRGARLALVGWISSQGLMFAAYVVLAHLVSPGDFGRYAAGSVLIGFGALFAESGMMSALINRRDRIEEAASTAFYSLLVSGSLLTISALALSPLLGAFFRSSSIGLVAAVSSGVLFLRALTVVPDSLLQRRFSFARRVVVDPLGALAFATVSIVMCARGAGVWGLVAGAYASMIVQLGAAWGFARFRPRLALASTAMWRQLAAFARSVVGSEILRQVARQLDAIVLGRVAGAATLGQYRNGLRLAQQPANAFVNVGAYVLLPTFAHLARDQRRLVTAARRVYGVAAAASVPASLASVPLGVPVAVLFLGSQWRPAGYAIAALWGVLLGGAIISTTSEVLKAIGRPEMLVRIHGFDLGATALGVSAAAIPFGLVGVATAVSVSQCLTALYAFRLVAPLIELDWRELGAEYAGPVLATGVMLAAMFLFAATVSPLSHAEAIALVLTAAQVAIGAVVYVASLMVVDPRRRNDVRRIVATRRVRHGSAPA